MPTTLNAGRVWDNRTLTAHQWNINCQKPSERQLTGSYNTSSPYWVLGQVRQKLPCTQTCMGAWTVYVMARISEGRDTLEWKHECGENSVMLLCEKTREAAGHGGTYLLSQHSGG